MINPAGAVPGNSQNAPTANVPRTRSTFPLKYHLFDTHRFGEYHPHYVEDSVKNDVLPIRSSHNVMSYTLKSPLMQSITMKKDYFSVPMEAILPENWEKFFDNPVRGDDVPSDVGPTVSNFWGRVGNFTYALWQALGTIISDSSSTSAQLLQATFRFLVVSEYFYSNGSLMTSLGCHGASYVSIHDGNFYRDFDFLFDSFIRKILSAAPLSNGKLFAMSVDGYTYDVAVDYDEANRDFISLNHALSLMRDNPAFVITQVYGSWTSLAQDLDDVKSDFTFVPTIANVPFNTSRLWAYQLCCAHYFTNDHIDFVYSAELFRQLIGGYWQDILTNSLSGHPDFFTRNGVQYRYDYLSAKVFSLIIDAAIVSTRPANLLLVQYSGQYFSYLGYFSALFAYRRSLRYLDYFTGSRAQPLAVGSTGVSVVNNTVDVVDVTRNIQRQRFLNAVNRVRHTAEGYLQGIFGGDVPAPDYHNPFFLAHTDDTIFGDETANTGAAQVDTTRPIAVTTNLRSNGSRYMLEIHSDRPCIVIGITHYDLPRVYGHSMERTFLHVDRFDMFNPFMQFVGDQPVYLQELGIKPNSSILTSMTNFSYSLRNMEYKQRYSQAAGAFVNNLPGWCFLTLDRRGNQSTINPDWIRSVPAEIDQFYNTLTGYSLGTYFHFIVDTFNDCSGSRPMAYAPSIL